MGTRGCFLQPQCHPEGTGVVPKPRSPSARPGCQVGEGRVPPPPALSITQQIWDGDGQGVLQMGLPHNGVSSPLSPCAGSRWVMAPL